MTEFSGDQHMIEEKVNLLKNDLEVLKFELLTKSKTWYREVSTLVAFAALVFSLGTTVVSYVRTAQQDVLNSRIELNSLIGEIAAIPEQNAKIVKTYQDSPQIMATLSAQLNNRNLVLAKQAASVIDRIESSFFGKGQVLDVEYLAVGTAFSTSLQYKKADTYFGLSVKRSTDPSAFASACRSKAGVAMAGGKLDEMRYFMGEALRIDSMERFHTTSQLAKDVVNINTELQWANVELQAGECVNANNHKISAETLLRAIPEGPSKLPFLAVLNELTMGLSNCRNELPE